MPTTHAIIICGGIKSPISLKELSSSSAMILCVDSGAEYALEEGIVPSAVIGDLDSISGLSLEKVHALGVPVHRYPVDKNETDLELTINYALSLGIQSITITCALGNRLDYTLGNLMLLSLPRYSGIEFKIIEDGIKGMLLRGGKPATLSGSIGETLSAIPFTQTIKGFSLLGVQWELSNVTLEFGSSWTLSNTFTQESVSASCEEGVCLLLQLRNVHATTS